MTLQKWLFPINKEIYKLEILELPFLVSNFIKLACFINQVILIGN